jgi:DNA-binding CsgD family transcriptional regulator
VVVLAIDVLVALGRSSEAATLAEGHLDRLRASAVAWIAAEADRAAAALMAATGDTGSAMSRSDRGLALARSAGMPFVLARALLTAGEIRRRGRQKARARDALTEAVEVFDRLGARIWAERARSELARVATRREPGAPLTATERGVADLVAAGRTNKEIADALFMSVHTVEAHLTRLFRTLGIQSRTELARMVIEGTDPHLAAADPDPDSSGGPATNI